MGDGTTEKLSHESGTGAKLTHSHTYLESGVYTIELRGDTIRRYPDGKTLSFSNDVKSYINLLDGSLGAVFEPSMVDGSKPSFYDTFNGCNNLEQIPETLFDGVSGIQQDMFRNTFANCSSLTTIPYNLFNSLSGSALNAFNETFANCSSLTSISTENGDVNYIPADMFVNMNNSENMFVNTFSGTGLTDRCPDNMENDDRTYFLPYASCKISGTYNIGYVLNGGTNYANAPTMYERYVGTVINGVPMRDGYLFGGWCDDSELTENCMVNKIIDSDNFGDKLFYAKWVEYIEPEFTITTTEMPVGTEFSFLLSASGDFFVNWGDGTAEHIIRTNVNETTYSHTYINGGNYTIGMSGTATGYNDTVGYAEEYNGTSTYYAPITTIAFHTDSNIYIESVAGSLGAIFGRLNSGSLKVPRFYFTFGGCENLKSIPSTLFSGLAGSAATNMFRGTFYNCSALTNIPDNLFANITNTSSMGGIFRYTFQGCSALTSIPENLFSSFSVSSSMFWDTFEGCKSLTEIPENLFSNIKGAATQLFMYTFKNCSSLKSIPVGLFSGIRGNASYLFTGVFDGCSSLETIPAGLFSGVTGSNTYMFQNTFYGCKNLKSIPVGLFSGVSGSASYMFDSTFRECSSLTSIPADLFVGVSGSATHLFDYTFSKCTGLTSLPDGLFRNISGGATYMFRDTFYTCSNIVSIPENLFGNVSGSATSMFSYTFYKNTKLKEIRLDNGNVVSYIPATMFANANNDTAITFSNTFYGTGLSTVCPNGLLNDGRDYWGGNKVSCMSSCGVGAYFDSDTNSCIPCYAGTYNDVAGATSCNLCPENWYTESRGSVSCSQCPDGLKSYSGSDEYADCGHILHVGDNKLYLRSVRKTTPSLNFMINNHIYYGSMTRDNKTMSKTTDKHLRINYNNEVWSVYDDTVE